MKPLGWARHIEDSDSIVRRNPLVVHTVKTVYDSSGAKIPGVLSETILEVGPIRYTSTIANFPMLWQNG